jgi:hypothetical protein
MAAARQKEIKDSITVVATKTGTVEGADWREWSDITSLSCRASPGRSETLD